MSEETQQFWVGMTEISELPEIISPIDGVIIDPNNIDQLADGIDAVKVALDRIRSFRAQLIRAICKRATLDAGCKTSYVRGDKVRVKIEQPPDAWNQSSLKQIYQNYPDLGKEYLRVGEVDVNLAKYKQLLRETGSPGFEVFKKELIASNKGKIGMPSVTVVRNENPNEESFVA